MVESVLVDIGINLGCAAIGYGANGFRRLVLRKRDHSRIHKWLVSESEKTKAKKFRTTQAIASHLNLPQERVRDICSRSKVITEGIGNDGLWSISVKRSAQ